MPKNSVSILISTFNGVSKLDKTLESLAKLDISMVSEIELVIVDNCSTDGTSKFCQEKWLSLHSPFQLRILHEKKLGKLFAQELGLSIISNEFVLICDDDNALASNYIKIAFEYFHSNPKIGVIGGQGIATSSIDLPNWFAKESYLYACAPQAKQSGNVFPERNVIYGAGMLFRKHAYDEAKRKGFTFILGSRTGKKLTTGGEDSELCWAIKFLGFEIWYIEELTFQHYLPPERLNLHYLSRLKAGMKSNGPLAKIYSRVYHSNMSLHVNSFWIKEFCYSLLDLIKILFLANEGAHKKILLQNLIFFIVNRNKYDRIFNSVIDFRNACLPDLNKESE
jgi:glycosyltransferase involved in cell wall biosynthesis